MVLGKKIYVCFSLLSGYSHCLLDDENYNEDDEELLSFIAYIVICYVCLFICFV